MVESFLFMLQFMTRIPINVNIDVKRDTIAKGTIFFPFIGVLVGCLSAVVYYLLSFINLEIASLAAIFVLVAVTGGLHIDGLSDTADGFFSSRSRERILDIMKDSRVGTFGVIAIVFDLLIKYVLLKSLTVETGTVALVLSCGIGRIAASVLFTFGKSARESGLGSMFTNNNTRYYFGLGTVMFAILGLLIGKVIFLVALIVVICFTLFFMKYSYKVIGGITGDVCGAACELGEIISLFVFMAVGIWI